MPLLLLVACARTTPTLDQPAWLAELRSRRPALMEQHVGSIRDPAWQALVLRPSWRPELLASEVATYETIVAREYVPALRALDLEWARSMREAQQAFVATAQVGPAGYDPRIYTGYRVGPPMRAPAHGVVLDYKVFFELAEFRISLSAERYVGFVERLVTAGFEGDSKIDLRPGHVRHQYNNVIVHAPTIELALCAEAVGLAHFGDDVLHVARGIDARVEGEPMDWHHFLLTGRYPELPEQVRRFVAYDPPVATLERCPGNP